MLKQIDLIFDVRVITKYSYFVLDVSSDPSRERRTTLCSESLRPYKIFGSCHATVGHPSSCRALVMFWFGDVDYAGYWRSFVAYVMLVV